MIVEATAASEASGAMAAPTFAIEVINCSYHPTLRRVRDDY